MSEQEAPNKIRKMIDAAFEKYKNEPKITMQDFVNLLSIANTLSRNEYSPVRLPEILSEIERLSIKYNVDIRDINNLCDAICIGDTVLVEQCWEDESGAYHDETAEVLSLDPLKLDWIGVSDEVRAFLDSSEFTFKDLQPLPSPPQEGT